MTYQVNHCFTGQHRMWKFEPTPVEEQHTASFTKRLNEQMQVAAVGVRGGLPAVCASNLGCLSSVTFLWLWTAGGLPRWASHYIYRPSWLDFLGHASIFRSTGVTKYNYHRPLAITYLNPWNKIRRWSTILWNYLFTSKNFLRKADGGAAAWVALPCIRHW